MAIKDFFWTFGEDGLDKYINKLLKEHDEYCSETEKEVKRMSEKFGDICNIFGINDFFRIMKEPNDGALENDTPKCRNGSYAFKKSLGCKLISLMPMHECEKLKSDLESDISQRNETVKKICDYINVTEAGRQNTKYNKVLGLINNNYLCEALSQCCFFEAGRNDCNCQLFKNDECIPLIISNIFKIYDKKRLEHRQLFEYNELKELDNYFCNLIMGYNNISGYKEIVRFAQKNKNKSKSNHSNSNILNPNLFNIIDIYSDKFYSNEVYIKKMEIHNILFRFDKTQVYNWAEWEIYIGDIFKNEIDNKKIANACISQLCRWYAIWEAVFVRYKKYINRKHGLMGENADDKNIELEEASSILEKSIWDVTHSCVDTRVAELNDRFKEKYNNQCKSCTIETALVGTCRSIIDEFFDSNIKIATDNDDILIFEEAAYADLQNIGKFMTQGWQLNDIEYIDSRLD